MKEGQIKGGKELVELMQAIDFISNKFDEYEKDSKEKEERVKILGDCSINISKRVDSLSGQVDKQEQYSPGIIVYCYMAFLKTRMKKLMIYALLL